VASALGVAWALAACGGTGGSASSPLNEAGGYSGRPAAPGQLTPERVRRAFRDRTGEWLAREDAGPGYEILALPIADAEGNPVPGAEERAARWGSFSIYVSAGADPLADVAQLGDLVPAEAAAGRRHVWREERDPLGETLYTAYRLYADGRVMLAWLSPAGRRTDASFQRLDAVLRGLDRDVG